MCRRSKGKDELEMKTNQLRQALNEGRMTMATRIESNWPTMIEVVGQNGLYDYVEFVAEYAPYQLSDFENMARAAELCNMAAIVKVDLQNRAYVAQKALASGFQGVLLVDHKTADEVRESIYYLKPDTPQDGGRFGYPNSRWIGYQPHNAQMDYAKMVRDGVIALMIEKKEAMDNIEEICSVPGVDMLQFGPSDYAMSCGWNMAEHREELYEIERKMIQVALAHGVHVRCEIDTPEQVAYYKNLGVKHFCLGDELRIVSNYWKNVGQATRDAMQK